MCNHLGASASQEDTFELWRDLQGIYRCMEGIELRWEISGPLWEMQLSNRTKLDRECEAGTAWEENVQVISASEEKTYGLAPGLVGRSSAGPSRVETRLQGKNVLEFSVHTLKRMSSAWSRRSGI